MNSSWECGTNLVSSWGPQSGLRAFPDFGIGTTWTLLTKIAWYPKELAQVCQPTDNRKHTAVIELGRSYGTIVLGVVAQHDFVRSAHLRPFLEGHVDVVAGVDEGLLGSSHIEIRTKNEILALRIDSSAEHASCRFVRFVVGGACRCSVAGVQGDDYLVGEHCEKRSVYTGTYSFMGREVFTKISTIRYRRRFVEKGI